MLLDENGVDRGEPASAALVHDAALWRTAGTERSKVLPTPIAHADCKERKQQPSKGIHVRFAAPGHWSLNLAGAGKSWGFDVA